MVFDHPDYDEHAQVTHLTNVETGLRAINAIHTTRFGTAGGGVRFRPYMDGGDALTDVLRLSRAMTYKMVLADLPMGGGKTVVIGDPAVDKTPDLLRALGSFIETLGGRYTAGPDVGTNSADMDLIAETTDHVVGLSSHSGSTAPPTALGVFHGLRGVADVVFGDPALDGRSVAVQGVGGVGTELVRLLVGAGASVTVADVDQAAVTRAVEQFGVRAVPSDAILTSDVDIVSPNAMGGILDASVIPRISAKAVCGSANNQLAEPECARLLADRGIVWAPDYVVSAGGAMAGVCEYGRITPAERDEKLAGIFDTTVEILRRSQDEKRLPGEIATVLVRERVST